MRGIIFVWNGFSGFFSHRNNKNKMNFFKLLWSWVESRGGGVVGAKRQGLTSAMIVRRSALATETQVSYGVERMRYCNSMIACRGQWRGQ